MGLRFRKSIKLFKGVKLNIGKTGVSISAGVPGFRKTFHSSGRVTTSVGIPGTGIYYVDTKSPNKKDKKIIEPKSIVNSTISNVGSIKDTQVEKIEEYNTNVSKPVIDTNNVSNIGKVRENCVNESGYHMTNMVTENNNEIFTEPDTLVTELFENCDYPVKWIDVLTNPYPIDNNYNEETWVYLRSKAIDVFNNSGEALIDVIEQINPYDDLLDYISEFEFDYNGEGTLDISCTMLPENLGEKKSDAASSVIIRLARDTFALLPVTKVHIKVDNAPATIYNDLIFDRNDFSNTIFENKAPQNLLSLLNTNGDI